ncbi:cysteine proteinase inhibitor A-like [Impatiens glandulifera]|uniref:cysteine proteinase inhibitor A-like n=1 Tax=Impatiens glandulifera TaxID=253017 RepID=UPI001FB12299|nr:cysteine proteinase inhibitor A-like [Impatiens glandulifera]
MANDILFGGIKEKEGSANSLEIEGLARFAIEDHNKKSNAQLELVNILKVEEQVVAGSIYYITLEATNAMGGGGEKKAYETKVWVKDWMNFKQVTEFKLVNGDQHASSSPTV